jgi:hypothetical protein
MKNFEVMTASELLNGIEYFYSEALKETTSNNTYLHNMNSTRLLVDIAQKLFNLDGFAITEVIEELKKIKG